MYLKGPKCHLFGRTLGLVGLEAGDNRIRPSLRNRNMIAQWPTPTSWEDLNAFFYLAPFLRWFIPGRVELVKIMKKGIYKEGDELEDKGGVTREEKNRGKGWKRVNRK